MKSTACAWRGASKNWQRDSNLDVGPKDDLQIPRAEIGFGDDTSFNVSGGIGEILRFAQNDNGQSMAASWSNASMTGDAPVGSVRVSKAAAATAAKPAAYAAKPAKS